MDPVAVFIFGILFVIGSAWGLAWQTEWRERGFLSWLKALAVVYFMPDRLCNMYYLTDAQLDVLDDQVEPAFPE